MGVVRSLALFVVAAIAEIGAAWLVWQGVREVEARPPPARRGARAAQPHHDGSGRGDRLELHPATAP
jgi:hypothetical protein